MTKRTLNTYDLERIARNMLKNACGDALKAHESFGDVVDKYGLTGDQCLDLSYMIGEIARGFDV